MGRHWREEEVRWEDIGTEKWICKRDRQTDRETETETDRQKDRETERQRDRETERDHFWQQERIRKE